MAAPLLLLQNIRIVFGTTALLDGAALAVGEGERICLVGRNGSGKSTLLKIAAGLMEPDRGERVARTGATIRYLPQEPDLSDVRDRAAITSRPASHPATITIARPICSANWD